MGIPAILTERQIEDRQRARLEPFVRKMVRLVTARVADARAHAENAVTQALKATPDGRQTALRARQSRSFQAAINRLDDLWEALAGPSVTSTSGMVHDAAEAFYEDSRDLWFGQIAPKFRAGSKDATNQQRAYVRSLLWFGLPVRTGLEQSFTAARNGLLVAIGQAGASDATRRDRAGALDAWEQTHRSTLIKRCGLALNDANQRADLQAMRDTIKPEYRDE